MVFYLAFLLSTGATACSLVRRMIALAAKSFHGFSLQLWLIALFFPVQNRLPAQKKNLVREFMGFTQTSEKVAIKCLNAVNWSVERAADHFYTNFSEFQDDV